MSHSDREPLLPTHVRNAANRAANALPSRDEVQRQGELTLAALVRTVGALSAGKLPTQAQLEAFGKALLKSDLLQSNAASSAAQRAGARGRTTARLSEEGDAVVEDIRAVIEAVLRIGAEKNGDDKFQEFLYTATHADVDVDAADPSQLVGVSGDEVQADVREAVAAIKQVGQLVLSSNAFRGILSDATVILRDLAADAAEVAADAAQQAADGASTAADKARSAAKDARPSEEERKQGAELPSLPSRDQARAQAKDIANRASSGAKDARGRASQAQQRVKQYIDEKTPDDAADKAIENVKKTIVATQKDERYRDAVSTIVNLVKKYGKIAQSAAEKAADGTEVNANDEAHEAIEQFRAIVETLAGGKDLDPLLSSFKKVGEDVNKSDDLKALFNKLDEYVDRLLFDPGFAMSHKASRQFDDLRKQARSIADKDSAWKEDISNLSDELQSFWTAFANDRAFAQLGRALDRLGDDLTDFGRTSSRALTRAGQGAVKDLIDVWLPRALGSIQSVPMPRVEYKSADLDFAVDDLSFVSASFQPDLIRLINHNDFSIYRGYAATASELDTSLTLVVRGLRLHATNISYYLNRKTGFFPYQDEGKIDLRLGCAKDDGLHFKVKLEPAGDENAETFFKATKVDVEIDGLEIAIHDSKHWLLNWLATPALRTSISKLLEKSLAEQIRSAVQQLDLSAFALQQRAVAAGQTSPTPVEYLKALVTPSPKPLTKRPKVELTSNGLVIKGPRGESLLSIGAPDSIFEGEGEGIKTQAKSALARARRAAAEAREIAAEARSSAEDAVDDTRRQARREARKEGWKSEAFDLTE